MNSSLGKNRYSTLYRVIYRFLTQNSKKNVSVSNLFQTLHIKGPDYETATQILSDLTQKDYISIKKNQIHILPNHGRDTIEGHITIHPKGFGFVTLTKKQENDSDIFIPAPYINGAFEGDLVEVMVLPNVSPKGPEGEVVSVLMRKKDNCTGIVKKMENKEKKIILHSASFGAERKLQLIKWPRTLTVGDRVQVKIVDWGPPIKGKISKRFGNISDPSIDIPSAIAEFNIAEQFPEEALEQAKGFGKEVAKEDMQNRRNLMNETCFTIDPTTAKDFDDALSISQTDNMHYHLAVHIADVAHYVREGSALDLEASKRCNSVYFPGECIPMLPKTLSNGLCSLRPHVPRLTMSVFMEFDIAGNLLHYSYDRTVIKSKHRFTYQEAKQILDGKVKHPFKKQLDLMADLCRLLKVKRRERGSLEFALPELQLTFDEKGNTIGFSIHEYDESHQLVEEFMVKANEIVATILLKEESPAIFRVHEPPTGDDLSEFYKLAGILGFPLPSSPTLIDIQKVFDKAKNTSLLQQLSIRFIRSMNLAVYSTKNIGHYGLGLEQYCHFTSPIRRYADLIIQRLLFREAKEVDIEAVASRCSLQERVAFKAESSVITLKKLRLLLHEYHKNRKKQYPALITSIKPFGIGFSLTPLEIEGFIHISEIGNDYYHYLPKKQILRGERKREIFRSGQIIYLQILKIDLISGEIQWKLQS
ncbi:MAG: ribonuclease R family protein [Chlamydiales bacterium]